MALTDKDVKFIAHLARLAVDPGQIADYRRELSAIVELFEALEAIDTHGVEPMAHPLDLEQRLRTDEVTEIDQREQFQSIAPEVSGGLYIVPKVLE